MNFKKLKPEVQNAMRAAHAKLRDRAKLASTISDPKLSASTRSSLARATSSHALARRR